MKKLKANISTADYRNSKRKFIQSCAMIGAALTIHPSSIFGASSSELIPKSENQWNPTLPYHCPQWFRDAKFGLWLHWGPQSIPSKGGGWYARHMYMEQKELGNEVWGKDAWNYHRETYGHQSEFGYKDICNLWKAEKFDADQTIIKFKKWGARFVAMIANHHDNYDLFNSSVHGWNTVNVGPKRDILGEFAEAARKHHLKWAATVHTARAQNYFEPSFGSDSDGSKINVPYDGNLKKEDGKGTWWEELDPRQLYASRYDKFESELTQRHLELVTRYQPDILYFDDAQIPSAMVPACEMLYRESLQKNGRIEAIITVKQPQKGTILDFEKGVAEDIQDEYWQTDTTIADDWFLKTNPDGSSVMLHNARSLKELLVDIVSKRGVLLLNIAARPDGTIPQDQLIVMDELGKWIEGNGEAIFDTQPWKIFGEGGLTTGGHFKERRISSTPWAFNVYRFTRDKNNKILYIHIFGDPAGKEIIINSLAEKAGLFTTRITKVTVIGNTAPVKWTNHENGLTIFMPDKLDYTDCNVIRVETTGLL